MNVKALLSVSIFFLLFSAVCTAQPQLSKAEVQDFFTLIKQTKEYKTLKAKTDSVNKQQQSQAPQELDIQILKKTDIEDDIFPAFLKRTVMGMMLEGYVMRYNKQTKQIISIQKQESRFQMN